MNMQGLLIVARVNYATQETTRMRSETAKLQEELGKSGV